MNFKILVENRVTNIRFILNKSTLFFLLDESTFFEKYGLLVYNHKETLKVDFSNDISNLLKILIHSQEIRETFTLLLTEA